MLEVQGLTKRYHGVPVVQDVSFAVRPGEIVGYLGPNGSGKSTTVKMLTGLLVPSAGTVRFQGRPIHDDLVDYRRRLGYVPEEPHVYPFLTGLEYLQLLGRLRGMPEDLLEEKSLSLLRLFHLHPHRHASLSAYSKGMRQRVLLAAALLHDPELLILDEPLSGLDVGTALLVRDLLRELAAAGKAILHISHVLDVVERISTRVVVIYRGRIMADDSVERLRDLMCLPSLEAIFGELVEMDDTRRAAEEIVAVMRLGP